MVRVDVQPQRRARRRPRGRPPRTEAPQPRVRAGSPTMTAILALDVGTTSIRAAIVDGDLAIRAMARRPFPPATPFPGLVEFDAAELVRLVLDAAAEAIAAAGEP